MQRPVAAERADCLPGATQWFREVTLFSAHELAHFARSYGPLLVGLLIALEAMGLPLPAESILVATAAYAGTSHRPQIIWIIVAAAAAAIIGDNLGYLIGRTLGWRVLRRWGRHVGLSSDRLLLGAWLFRRHGGKVVFLSRFVAVLRTLVSLLAGANRMDWWWFLPSNAAGGIVWSCMYGLGGFWFGETMKRLAKPAGIGIAIVAGVLIALGFLLIHRREQELITRARREMGGGG